MRVLIIGSGGREHAIVTKVAASPLVDEVHCAPGNAGIARQAVCHSIADSDIPGILGLTKQLEPGLVVIGPEAPLCAGLADTLRDEGFRVFGPGRDAAMLEGSKAFAKEVMIAAGVPTAGYARFVEYQIAMTHLAAITFPVVVKANGLAAGKGVIIAEAMEEAEDALRTCFIDRSFGDAGLDVLVEECLIGHECSVLALCDGETILPLEPAQDYKRIYDGDSGPNTGGMGCYSPVPRVPSQLVDEIIEMVHRPTVAELARRGIEFRGVLYAGLMLTPDGPRVLEFNTRFGDPETQAILPRLENDLVELMIACAEGSLSEHRLRWKEESCVTVIMASAGYPLSSSKGDVITGLELDGGLPGVEVYHAGTAEEDSRFVTNGGRVLAISALDRTFTGARKKAYDAVGKVHYDGMQYRRDIAAEPARGEG
ncbi:MAG: phosphoribosylamine--glycine ligase [Thermoleophilia bacterium]|nr:phosphoribosylamine--glycine ligase [Thermoleophilia bacterium]